MKLHHLVQAYFIHQHLLMQQKNHRQLVEDCQKVEGIEERLRQLEKIETGIFSQLRDDDGSILIIGKLVKYSCQSFISSIFSLCRFSPNFFKK